MELNLPNMSEPWYITRNKLYYTLGMSPHTRVSSLIPINDNLFILLIFVNYSFDIAQAVRAIVPYQYKFDTTILTTVVLGPNLTIIPHDDNKEYTIEDVEKLYTLALKDNPLFFGVLYTNGVIPPTQQDFFGDLVIVIKDYIIQFFNDDSNNLCQNYINIASIVFSEVINLNYNPNIKISFTIYDPKSSILESNLKKYAAQ